MTMKKVHIETRLFKPVLTTQYPICPVPFRMDTYQGCKYTCNYCFARYFTTYARRREQNAENRKFTHLVGNDPDKFRVWLRQAMTSEYNFKRGEEVALKERIPLKLGGVSDPFPPLEIKWRITHRVLEALHEYDYPVNIQTKNPSIVSHYIRDFDKPNWNIAVTLISLDDNFVRTCEPGAPSPKNRLKSIERIVSNGGRVICKIQPAIYPKIIKDLPDLVKAFKDHGAWAFNTEGLKVRIVMNEHERNLFEKIGRYSGDDEFENLGIRRYYRLRGIKTGSDMEIDFQKKREYTDLALSLAAKHNITYFTADNYMGKVGHSCECCGTEVLRNYKIWGDNFRTRYWGTLPHESLKMRKVVINTFSYSTDPRRYKTLGEVMDKELNPKQRSLL